MLKELSNDGYMRWDCSKCGHANIAHVKDAGVQYSPRDPNMVSLPACICGSQTQLKVNFTDKELRARNIVEPFFDGTIAGEEPTPSLVVVRRHQQLAVQMQAAGKSFVAPHEEV